MSGKAPFPKVSKSQDIGALAQLAFNACHPQSWYPKPLDGDDDFGFDYHIQVKDNGQVKYAFRAQLKGSTIKEVDGNDCFPVSLKSSTLNLYRNVSDPVLLLVADLSANSEARKCPVYFAWVHDEIREKLGGKQYFSDEKVTHAFHVPIANELTEISHEVILTYLQEHIDKHHLADAFYTSVTTKAPGQEKELIREMQNQIENGKMGVVNGLFTDIGKFPWPTPSSGTASYYLKEINGFIEINDIDHARRALEKISNKQSSFSSHEMAEFQYQSARVLLIENRREEAATLFESAHKFLPDESRYLVGWFESRLGLIDDRDKGLLEEILNEIPDSTEALLINVKALVMGLLGNYQDALELLDGYPPNEVAITKLKIYLLSGQWDTLADECQTVIEMNELSDRDVRLAHLFACRAKFIKAFNIEGQEYPLIIPAHGTTSMNIEMVVQLWQMLMDTVDLLRKVNWPISTEYIMDMLAISALVLEKQDEALSVLKEIAHVRGYLHSVSEALERVALAASDYATVINSLDQREEDEEVVCKRLIASYENKYPSKVVEEGTKLLGYPGTGELFPICLGIAVTCCDDLIDSEQKHNFINRLSEKKEWLPHLAVAEFVVEISDPLQRTSALDQLRHALLECPDSLVIQSHLFLSLNPLDESESKEVLELASEIQKQRGMGVDEILHLGQALITNKNWTRLVELSDVSILQYGDKAEFHALKATGLDNIGEVSGALASLDVVVEKGLYDPTIFGLYIRIASRSGMTEKAISLVKTFYSRAKSRERKLDALRLWFNLEYKVNPSSSNLIRIAQKIGEIANAENESEEALYLNIFFAATMGDVNDKRSISDDVAAAFRSRVRAFTEKFPESRYLQMAELPDDGEILEKLNQLIGMTPERIRHYEKVQRQLRDGGITVPFSWKPALLNYVHDIIQLWEISKNCSKDASEFHLTIKLDVDANDVGTLIDQVPVLDLPSIILLEDLGLLELTIAAFAKVAVPKVIVAQLVNLSHPLSGSFRIDFVDHILSILRSNFEKILQPGEVVELDDPVAISDEILRILSSQDFVLYSDDAVFRAYVALSQPEIRSITSQGMIEFLEAGNIISCNEATQMIAKLCRWNVSGVDVRARHFLTAIPSQVFSLQSSNEMVDLMRKDQDFMAIVDGIWDVKKPYQDLIAHISWQLRYLADDNVDKIEVISAVWQAWVIKAQFNKEFEAPAVVHLRSSFVMAVITDPPLEADAISRLWVAYCDAFVNSLGTKADEQSHIKGIRSVAEFAASVVSNEETKSAGIIIPTIKQDLFEILSKGLVDGTSDREVFKAAYEAKRLASL